MGAYPPPPPFIPSFDIAATAWIDDALQPLGPVDSGFLVGQIVPNGYEAYARIFHPARRFIGPSIQQSVPLRWSEIAGARGKTVHPEMQIERLMDNMDAFDYRHWKTISTGGGEWFPPYEWLESTECLAIGSLLRQFTTATADAWFMRWDGYGDLGPAINNVPLAMIHPDRSGTPLPRELAGRTLAFRHYLVFRAPLDGLAEWFRWSDEAPNYWWPDDRSWVVVTEIDGFSTYVGGSLSCIESLLASPRLEALPAALNHRFDIRGDTINVSSK